MTNKEFYNCTTISMGKYVDFDTPQFDVEEAKAFVKAFALWFEFDFFDENNKWLVIKISYINDNFFCEDILRTIKFFMQFHDYSYISSTDERRSVYDDNEEG